MLSAKSKVTSVMFSFASKCVVTIPEIAATLGSTVNSNL